MAATPAQFRADHPDIKTWMPADYESYEVLVENTGKTPRPVTRPDPACWFCGAENSPTVRICGFCHHHESDGPGYTPAA